MFERCLKYILINVGFKVKRFLIKAKDKSGKRTEKESGNNELSQESDKYRGLFIDFTLFIKLLVIRKTKSVF